jgi:homoserine dehydrogenase
VLGVCERALKSGKHLVTANKALLAERGEVLFSAAREAGLELGFEAAVCGAIPVIRVVKDSFAGDEVSSLSGIMNGTSNYVLSKMQAEDLSFQEALSLAQSAGYAEADPTLDIGGGDAGHKLALLIRLAFGRHVDYSKLSIRGIQDVSKGDIRAAKELDCAIKLICQAQLVDGVVHAAVSPMMVKQTNVLSRVNGATNAIRFMNRYSGEHILVGKGAGSLETGSAVVADIVFIARNAGNNIEASPNGHGDMQNLDEIPFPYTLIFDTEDVPGITGLVATAIGDQGINIDTVGHNLHGKDVAVFCVETMPCTRNSVVRAIAEMQRRRPGVFRTEPKIYPVLN